ncbi:hypothetical protein K2Q16_04255 [Patescibacteria group bacterium]|nr:hypothetical protein [Patescibacteria group bacterium]
MPNDATQQTRTTEKATPATFKGQPVRLRWGTVKKKPPTTVVEGRAVHKIIVEFDYSNDSQTMYPPNYRRRRVEIAVSELLYTGVYTGATLPLFVQYPPTEDTNCVNAWIAS